MYSQGQEVCTHEVWDSRGIGLMRYGTHEVWDSRGMGLTRYGVCTHGVWGMYSQGTGYVLTGYGVCTHEEWDS